MSEFLYDLKEYDPQKEIWYKILKEIQEKGINFDYKLEVTKKIYRENLDSNKQITLKKKI